jgi:hypothetical protein
MLRSTRSLQPTPDGALSSASRTTSFGPACVSSGVGCITARDIKTLQQTLRLVVFGLCTGILLVSCSPPTQNDERESGYYGDFNRVSNALVSIQGVVITNFWMNRDITLEEFGFDITTATGKPVHIAVGERDRLRRMPRAELVEALEKEIERQ